jgi:hypothetical protein
MKKMGAYFLLLAIMFSALFAGNSNLTVTFQGRLIDSIGSPVNGTRKMQFRIYDKETVGTLGELSIPAAAGEYLQDKSGSPVHTVICNDGNYATEILLRPEEVVSLNSFEDAYLEIYVGSSTAVSPTDIMSPRVHLSATPYAIKANQIEGLVITGRDGDSSRTTDGINKDMHIYY